MHFFSYKTDHRETGLDFTQPNKINEAKKKKKKKKKKKNRREISAGASGFEQQISKGAKIDCLSFVMCLLLAQLIIGFFFLLRPFTVLMKKTRQAVHAVKQSIFLDVYDSNTQT